MVGVRDRIRNAKIREDCSIEDEVNRTLAKLGMTGKPERRRSSSRLKRRHNSQLRRNINVEITSSYTIFLYI